MQTLLMTGFEPFGGDHVNPSWEAVRRLDGMAIEGVRIVALQVPCVFATALRALEAGLTACAPIAVISAGLASNRSVISLERVAINVDDARIADNAGAKPVDMPIVVDGPAAYFSTLPVRAITQALEAASIPAEISNSAGTFVCNRLFYGLRHRLALQNSECRAGFIHVPASPDLAARHRGQPSMALDLTVEALRIAARCTIASRLRDHPILRRSQ